MACFTFCIIIKASSTSEASAILDIKEYEVHQKKSDNVIDLLDFDLNKIQKSYKNGNSINWFKLYGTLTVEFNKVNLPLYEFDRQEYWFGINGKIKNEYRKFRNFSFTNRSNVFCTWIWVEKRNRSSK